MGDFFKLSEVCKKESSNIAMKDLAERTGDYEIYGASGLIKKVDFYQQEQPYIAIVKDGAGVGRVMKLPAKSSVIGTMQYIIPNEGIDVNFLAYALEHLNLAKYNTGATIPHIYFKDYCVETIPAYSPDEQKYIACTLDKISFLISLRKQQLSKLDELVKSRFVELFGEPETNPMGWKNITVRQAINEKIIDKPLDGNHGEKHPKTSDYVPAGVPFIMANNLVDGRVDLENCAFISQKQANSLDKGFARDGDVLITHKGTIGRTAILHCTYPYIMLTPQVTYYRPITGIIPEYLKAYFDTDYFQGVIGNIASAGSTRAYIGITAQQELPLLIPPMEKQKEYAAFVQQTDKSKLAIQKSLEKLETLKKALMQKYFE